MVFRTRLLVVWLFLIFSSITYLSGQTQEWKSLLDKDLTSWDVYMGVPHHSIVGLDSVPKGDGMNGVPLGLNIDPLKVFSTIEDNEHVVLHVSGEIYGGLTSKEVYENYHLKFEFKWGEKKWEPRLKDKRDNGLLYHCNGPHGAFWNVWMESQEFQIQEGDMGDYFGLAGAVNNISVVKNEDDFFQYHTAGEVMQLGTAIDGNKMYRAVRSANYEKPNGQWNTLELVCFNGKSYHIVNGEVVMILNQAERKTEEGFNSVTKGKIQLQSEAAEAFYRNINIREITAIPDFLK